MGLRYQVASSQTTVARKCEIKLWYAYLLSSFLHKLTCIHRQNLSCEKIPKSQNSDKATSFCSVVVNIALSVQKVS